MGSSIDAWFAVSVPCDHLLHRSIPWGDREDLYHSVQFEIATVGESNTPHAIIMLIHPTDHLHHVENQLPPGIFITRALRSIRVKLLLNHSMQQLHKESLEFVDFERKLFGPQEAELDAKDFHPTMFQEKRDQHKNMILQQIQQLPAASVNTISHELNKRGYRSTGTRVELESRLRAVLLDEVSTTRTSFSCDKKRSNHI